jgi:hypothetical protein
MQEYHQSRRRLLQLQTKHQQPKLALPEHQAQQVEALQNSTQPMQQTYRHHS